MQHSAKASPKSRRIVNQRKKRLMNMNSEKSSDVLVSAVISPYLLTHLHQILQKSEFNAKKDGRISHAANFAKLRKVLCLDARSMQDASAQEIIDTEIDGYTSNNNQQNVA
tara:strand:+ start:202 stop:534 length:333 start_codon:yes stop_codon:yes gene_type:complete